MLYIKKQTCPVNIREDIKHHTADDVWKELPELPREGTEDTKIIRNRFRKLDKEQLRAALIAEQRGLCAYCMAKITNDQDLTTVEHWYPLSKSKSKAMDYNNYLAVCHGGRKTALEEDEERILCCDAKKNHTVVKLDPRSKKMIDGLAYHDDGRIYANYKSEEENRQINYELSQIFGLNGVVRDGRRVDTATGIIKKRRDTYAAIENLLLNLHSNNLLTQEILERRIQAIMDAEQRPEFAGVTLFVLKKYKQLEAFASQKQQGYL